MVTHEVPRHSSPDTALGQFQRLQLDCVLRVVDIQQQDIEDQGGLRGYHSPWGKAQGLNHSSGEQAQAQQGASCKRTYSVAYSPPLGCSQSRHQPILNLYVSQNKATLSREGNFIYTCFPGWLPLDSTQPEHLYV